MTEPTVTCPKCKVDVPVAALGIPNRCHKDCPLLNDAIRREMFQVMERHVAEDTRS